MKLLTGRLRHVNAHPAKTDLRTLIALLAITSIVITLANTLYATGAYSAWC